MNADQQGIVPLALAHNLDACLAYSLLISRSYRQIGNIDGQILPLSALYGTGREKICRATYREGSVTEVFVSEIRRYIIHLPPGYDTISVSAMRGNRISCSNC